MSTSRAWDEPFLPWVESENDRRFKKILLIVIIVFAILALIVSFFAKTGASKKRFKNRISSPGQTGNGEEEASATSDS